jgi:hypothetical protein
MPTWNDLLVTSHGWSPSSTCSGGRRGDRSPGSTTRTQIKFVASTAPRHGHVDGANVAASGTGHVVRVSLSLACGTAKTDRDVS